MKPGNSGVAQQNFFDGLAIGVSITCLAHCLALPVLIAFLPAWSTWLVVPETFHLALLAFAAPLSLAILLRAARGRSRFAPLRLGVTGLIFMTIGLFMQGTPIELLSTSLGAAALASGHVLNWRRRSRCG